MEQKDIRSLLPADTLIDVLLEGIGVNNRSIMVIETQTGKIVAHNAAAEKMFGYDANEMLGMHIKTLDAESYIGIRQEMHHQHTEGQYWEGEITNKTKDGSHILTSIRSISIGDYYISDQKEVKHEAYLNFFENIFPKDGGTGFIILNDDLKLLKINEPALKVYPKETEESLKGKNLLDLVPSLKLKNLYDQFLVQIGAGNTHEVHGIRIGQKFFNLHFFRIHKVGIGVVSIDVTEQVKAIEKAEYIQGRAVQSNKFKDDILRKVSSEFRTPLHGLKGLLEVLSNNPDKEISELVRSLQSVNNRIQEISDRILDLQAIENHKLGLKVEAVDIQEFMAEIVSMLGADALEKQMDFGLNIDPSIKRLTTDKSYLSMILVNLIGNAIKFSPPKSRIEVKVHQPRQSVLFQVIDTGIGINPKFFDKIFDEYYQVQYSSDQRYDGIGLGLYNSERYARQIKGDITVQSTPGKGSTFTLIAPYL